ncbi:lasso peptide biosynthesis B2 protein [Lentzea sp. NBC_00516]|uniref:lasso peptide biosynthesis B2 protein n=1 Tax=Lentzea sp. NBC_00516 TaxID=2903582 RepID=UPI002E81E872|nr:lasso peptide biosynthesis B2 protein [Lentzea sp. NBC_00516]WUD28305.1 lasso peptide biosynthesis B2 protein [Lentzea sp. NBC_00516]
MSSRIQVPAHLHSVDGQSGATYVLDVRSGQWLVLNSPAARLWRVVVETGDVDQGIDVLAAGYASSVVERFRADAHETVRDMFVKRLLITGAPAAPRGATSGRPSGAVRVTTPPRARTAVLGLCSLLLALVLLRLPFRHTVRFVNILTGKWCTRPVKRSEALDVVAAVEAAADHYPGRAACLERSLGAVIAAAIQRRRLQWVLGVAEDPSRFHAWVEVEGKIVTRSAESQPAFLRVFSV